jgi:hypothetical protein
VDAFAHDVEDSVDDLAASDGRRATAGFGRRDEGFQALPLDIGEVGGVSWSDIPSYYHLSPFSDGF